MLPLCDYDILLLKWFAFFQQKSPRLDEIGTGEGKACLFGFAGWSGFFVDQTTYATQET